MISKKILATFGLTVIATMTIGMTSMELLSNDSILTNISSDNSHVSGVLSTTNPFELRQNSLDVIKGNVVSVEKGKDYRDEYGNALSKDGPLVVAKIPVTFYSISVDTAAKNTIKDEVVTVRTMHNSPSYNVGDEVLIMVGKYDGENFYRPWAGPYGMFKVENGYAFGIERTIPTQILLNLE